MTRPTPLDLDLLRLALGWAEVVTVNGEGRWVRVLCSPAAAPDHHARREAQFRDGRLGYPNPQTLPLVFPAVVPRLASDLAQRDRLNEVIRGLGERSQTRFLSLVFTYSHVERVTLSQALLGALLRNALLEDE